MSIALIRGVSILTLVFGLVAESSLAAEPVVAVWYRGTPLGTPKLDDLAAIKVAGFGTIVWPSNESASIVDVSRLARAVGLNVVLQSDAAGEPRVDGRMTVEVARLRAHEIPAIVWRGVAHGVRMISFDPGPVRGAGLDRDDGRRRDWVAPAVALARQLSANARLIAELRPGAPPTFVSLRPASLDVQLLEGSRAWVIVATNTGEARAEAEVMLPKGVPYAIWVSLLDESTIAMRGRPTGARWSFNVDAGAAAVYVIDKELK